MKLTRLTVNQIRQFRQPLTISDLTDGINLFVGPNESGKSTLVRAIRAAFFERYTSNSAEDLRPWGDSSAAPEIELEFEWQQQKWKLNKRFLNKKRCDLQINQQHLSGAEAEDKLAELLGFEFSSRGGSKPEHWGIPGLLWVEQGSIQDIQKSVEHAGQHLKTALSNTLGEVTSTAGDALIEQVENERAILLTKTGKPTGQYQKILLDCEQYQIQLKDLDEKIQRYRSDVDRLGQLRRQRQEHDSQKPWLEYRQKAEEAKNALAAVQDMQAKQQSDLQLLQNCQNNLNLCLEQLRDFRQGEEKLAQRAQDKTKAAKALEDCKELSAQITQRLQQAQADYQKAKDALSRARLIDRRQNLQRDHDQLNAQLNAQLDNLQKAQQLQNELQALRAKLQAQTLDEKLLAKLKQLQNELTEIQIRQQSLATRLEYDLEAGKSITISGQESIQGKGERLLLEATDLFIPGIGKLRLLPGGTDIRELARKQERLRLDYTNLLQTLKVQNLEQAENRLAENKHLAQQITHLQAQLQMLGPKGVDELNVSVQLIKQRVASLQTELEKFPAEGGEQSDFANADLKTCEAHLEAKDAELKTAERAHQQHQSDLLVLQNAYEAANLEWQKQNNELQSPERQARERDALDRLSNLKAEEAELHKRIDERKQQIEAANPEALQKEIERLSKSADALEKEALQREGEITRLKIHLESIGAEGAEEKRTSIQQELERLQRHRDEMQNRAAALDLLLNLLKQKRQELTRQLQAPLQKHLNHYLKLLFPGATLTVDENLRPQILTREQEHGDVISLSYGAREQIGLLSRLAYADLLKTAGRPTLIILDDALVHCDGERLEQMKRILFDAGERHQILLFSCHPERWRGLGVVARGWPLIAKNW